MKLIAYMADQSLSDDEMAFRAGCSRTQINRIKRGVCEPSFLLALAIERVTDGKVTPSDLARANSRKGEEVA